MDTVTDGDVVEAPDDETDGDILTEVVGDDNTLTEGNED
jgi:hypothetical protein